MTKQFISVIFKHKECGKYSASKIDLEFNEDETAKAQLLNEKYQLVDKYCCRCLNKFKKPKKLTEEDIIYHPRKYCHTKEETLGILIRDNRSLI